MTTSKTPSDPKPWVTEDGTRQNTSVVPYRLGGRTYADYAPREVEFVKAFELRPGDEMLTEYSTRAITRVGHDFKRHAIEVTFADGETLLLAPKAELYAIKIDINTERG